MTGVGKWLHTASIQSNDLELSNLVSKTLSDHAVANSWWSPSSLPAWLNKEFYVQKIQPQLRTVKVREIAQAMQVSQPYAAFIRSGRRNAHPRHWLALLALAELAGFRRTGACLD
jgi:hypothetical protein